MTLKSKTSTREGVLSLLLRHGEVSAMNLAENIGISVQAMRRHLRSLKNDGLVRCSSISDGPGRPSKLWQLTDLGHNCFNNGNGSEKLAIDLLASIQANLSEDDMKEAFNLQTIQQASDYRRIIGLGPLNVRLQKLIDLRKKEGYLADLQVSQDGLACYVNAFYCSIRNVAEQYPVLCDQELLLMRHVFPDCEVDRVQWRLESGHACGFQINSIQD